MQKINIMKPAKEIHEFFKTQMFMFQYYRCIIFIHEKEKRERVDWVVAFKRQKEIPDLGYEAMLSQTEMQELITPDSGKDYNAILKPLGKFKEINEVS